MTLERMTSQWKMHQKNFVLNKRGCKEGTKRKGKGMKEGRRMKGVKRRKKLIN
jgi:hypothetical protein